MAVDKKIKEAKKAKILIAEDEKSMAKALELKLNRSGFEVKTVTNGVDALKELLDGKFDLVLLDLIMPGVDGFGVLEEIKNKKIKTKVVVTSNLSQQEDVDRAKAMGALDYLVKSDTPIQAIVEKVKSLI